jgi:UDP-N-acetylmuramoyl-L-alanyl-D-glutamate--2,6-diaminopimelate ligase
MMRNLSEVLAHFGVSIARTFVNHLKIDSRDVQENDVFVALSGHQVHGATFISAALERGAACVLIDVDYDLGMQNERIIAVPKLEQVVAKLAHDFYNAPSKAVQLVGVTGTNGKSTTTTMIANLATQCQQPGSVVGTLGYGKPDALIPLANTTPSHIDVARILATLAQDNKLVAMEVSSHGLSQGRVDECQFEVGVFTNLSRDHLDYHGDMQSYAQAKLRLFTGCQPKIGVVNFDDEVGRQWLKQGYINNAIAFGKVSEELLAQPHFVAFQHQAFNAEGVQCELVTSWGTTQIVSSLYGEFNLYNLAASFAALLGLGFSLDALTRAVVTLEPVAGRMQPFYGVQKPTCLVDYAHTPDALEQALKALQQHVPGKVTCLFGCGGDRDKGKRPQMAAIAERYADNVIVTSDNPRTEDPDAIIQDILVGFTSLERVQVEADRAKAIALAVATSSPESVVLVAGKGHEDYQIVGTKVLPFCDRQVVKRLLEEETA